MVPDTTAQRTWEAALGRLQLQVTRPSYDTWLRDTVGVELDGRSLVVGVPTTFAAEWLGRRMHVLIEAAVASVARTAIDVTFRVHGLAPSAPEAPSQPLEPPDQPPHDEPHPSFDDRYTFESFISGSCNQLAYAASMAVADAPGRAYNPLFLYGGVGLGKTHLLHAIGVRARAAGHSVRYATAEQFTNEYLAAIREHRTPAFRDRYRSVDVLLLDDIQFICGKEATQEGLSNTFNALHQAGHQLVVAADRPPAAMPLLQSHLRSRLQWGLLADVATPDIDTRTAILRHYASQSSLSLPDEVIAFIADRCTDSVRILQGSLNRLAALATLTHRPPTLDLAREAVACFSSPSDTLQSPKATIDTVAAHYNLPPAALIGPRRDRPASTARHVAAYLLHEALHLTPEDIGRTLGGRDRTTVLYAIKRITTRIPTDPQFATAIQHLHDSLSHNT